MENVILSPISLDELEARIDNSVQKSLKGFFESLNLKGSGEGQPDIIPFKEGCKLLNITESTGYSKISKRELPFIKKGKFVYFSRKKLIEWLHSGEKKTLEELEVEADTLLKTRRSRKETVTTPL